MRRTKIVTKICYLIAAISIIASGPVRAQGWDWTVAPYLWASDVKMDLSINGNQLIGGDASFKDLLDKTDSVFMGHFEGRNGNWGLYADTIYLDLGDSKTMSVGPGGPILDDFMADAGLNMKLYDFGGLYRVGDPDADVTFDLLAGVRYVDVDIDVTLSFPLPGMEPVDIRKSPSETDLMLGGRLIGKFAERWHWGLRGDFSFGGTDGTYNLLAAVGYTFGQSGLFSLDLGYRYMSIDIGGTTRRNLPSEADIVMSGPVLGFVFQF
jgi:hypothetical protein